MDHRARLVAKARLTPVFGTDYGLPRFKDIAEEYSDVIGHERMAARLFDRALERHLIDVTIKERYRTDAEVDEGLTASIQEMARTLAKDPTLRVCVVRLPDKIGDIEAHVLVGRHIGHHFLSEQLRPGDQYFTSAGRAAYGALDCLIELHHETLSRLRGLYALTGSASSGPGQIPGVSIDADSLVLLAAREVSGLKVWRTMLPLALPRATISTDTGERQLEVVPTIAPFLRGWDERRPDVVVLGLGLIGDAFVGRDNPFLKDLVTDLVELTGQHDTRIGEIGHHLFVDEYGTADHKRVDDLVAAVSLLCVTPTLQDFAHAKRLCLVTAGADKGRLIPRLLTRSHFIRPNVVWIDTAAAKAFEAEAGELLAHPSESD